MEDTPSGLTGPFAATPVGEVERSDIGFVSTPLSKKMASTVMDLTHRRRNAIKTGVKHVSCFENL